MRRALVMAALLVCGFATPAYAQDDSSTSACIAQNMQSVVRPILQQAMQFSPQGMNGSYVPLAQPFAPGGYVYPPGFAPGPPGLAPPTAQYNVSSGYTGIVGLPQPGSLNSQQVTQFLLSSGRINPAAPNPANAELLIALANLQQTEQARQQQQALLQQQQGLYQNSLYQLSASYQVTSLDWAEAYSTLAQAWMSYYRDLCRGGDSGGSFSSPPPSPVGSPTQNMPGGYPTR